MRQIHTEEYFNVKDNQHIRQTYHTNFTPPSKLKKEL